MKEQEITAMGMAIGKVTCWNTWIGEWVNIREKEWALTEAKSVLSDSSASWLIGAAFPSWVCPGR